MYNLQLVLHSNEILNVIANLKQKAGFLLTNFFLDEKRIKELVNKELLYIVSGPSGALFFKSNDDFLNLYFVVSRIDILKSMISLVKVDKTIILDLIAREKDNLTWQESLSEFTQYAVFQRMFKLSSQEKRTWSIHQEVLIATVDDAQAIYDVIVNQFDRFSEHFPSIEEIVDAIQKQSILVIKDQSEINAFLFFENIGITSILRYWFVDSANRGQHLGSRLMSSYLACNQEVKRFILWVNKANTEAIMKYQYFGFQPDGTIDTILLKRCRHG